MSDLHTLKRPASVDLPFAQGATFQPSIRHEQRLVITAKPSKAHQTEHFQELAIGIDDSNTMAKKTTEHWITQQPLRFKRAQRRP